jgi:16S rRNA (cytosine967-C5)-methyltransferase
MRSEQQLRTFLRILDEYPANTPLAKFLPVYFRKNKQMGSSDRRSASRLLYTFFRLGKAAAELSAEERLFIAEFLCNAEPSVFLEHFRPEMNSLITQTTDEKLRWLAVHQPEFKPDNIFPFHQHLSNGISKDEFIKSLLIQPDLFIRLHPGKEELVKSKLRQSEISFTEESPATLRLPNGSKLEQVMEDAGYFEIQDLSSQQTGQYFEPKRYEQWWDACAASGGKSLLLFHEQPEIKLLVSDIRESVLHNLDERFAKAGLRKYHKKELDLLQNQDQILHHYEFDGIILDAPCTGSGTWGRTPEMISQFEEHKIQSFQNLQKAIVQNVVKYLKPSKPLIYITCSVFREENEDVVDYLTNELGLKLEKSEVLKGYEKRADTMFVARLLK